MIRHATRWLPTNESRTVYYHIICRLSFRSLRQSKATIKIEQIPDQFILGVLNMLFLLKVCRSSLLLWPDSFQNYTCKKPFTSSEKNICSARVCEWAILKDIPVEREREREREREKKGKVTGKFCFSFQICWIPYVWVESSNAISLQNIT